MTVRSPEISPAHRRVIKRGIRIGVAAGLATLCSQLLHLPNPWFATVAAIVAVQGTLQATFRSGRNSLVGAFIGAALGLGVAYVAKDQAWAVALVVAAPLVLFGWFRLPAIGQQAALVASVVVLVPESTDFSTFDFALIRLSQAVIGIVVAMAVQAVLFPPRAHRTARRELGGVYRDMAHLLGSATEVLDGQPRRADAVRQARIDGRARLAKVDDLWDDAMAEHPSHGLLGSHWRVTTRRIWEQCAVLSTEVADAGDSALLRACRDELTTLTLALQQAMHDISGWFRHAHPDSPIELTDLEPVRLAALNRVRRVEQGDRADPYPRTLQALAVANACNVIAERLTDLDTQHRDAVRVHGPAE